MLLRWEAVHDWKEKNPRGTLQDFDLFWDAIQQEKGKLSRSYVAQRPGLPVVYLGTTVASR